MTRSLRSLLLLALLDPFAATAQPAPPVPLAAPTAVIDRQIAAYSARDIEAFMACFGKGAVLHILAQKRDLSGADAIRAVYGASFRDRSQPRHIELRGRVAFGPFVTDYEAIADHHAEAMVTYSVRDGLIQEVWIHQAPAR